MFFAYEWFARVGATKEKGNEWQSALTLLSTFQGSADGIACTLDKKKKRGVFLDVRGTSIHLCVSSLFIVYDVLLWYLYILVITTFLVFQDSEPYQHFKFPNLHFELFRSAWYWKGPAIHNLFGLRLLYRISIQFKEKRHPHRIQVRYVYVHLVDLYVWFACR